MIGGPTGGLGLMWHREGGGCGLMCDAAVNACTVLSEALCPADLLEERNQSANQVKKHFGVTQHCTVNNNRIYLINQALKRLCLTPT